MAVNEGINCDVTENLYSHEDEDNSKKDSHNESTVPAAGDAFFIIK